MAAPVTPIRQRTQYTCTAASLSMALKALGLQDCGEDKVNEVIGAAPMQGAAWEQVAAAANHYGCRSTLVVPSTLVQVRQWTDAGKPVLIGWNPEGRPWSHASLIYDVTDTHVMVADPNCPDPLQTVREVPYEEFYRKWSEEWNGYKVRRPAMLIDREVDSEGRQVMASRRKAVASSKRVASMWLEAGWHKVGPKQNPRVTKGPAPFSIVFDHPRLSDYMWTTQGGLKPGIKMWFGGMKPMEFSTEAEATKEITSKVLDHIHQYKDDFAEFIKGWEK